MALWGTSDAASNSPFYTPEQFKTKANSANRTALFGNTTANNLGTGETIGVYGVSATEMGGKVLGVTVTAQGTGATVRPTVTIEASPTALNGGVNATATAVGAVVAAVVNNAGSGGSYVPGNILTTAGGTGTQATINVTRTAVRTVTTTAANGTGFANGDTVRLGNTTQNAVFTVTTGGANTSVASLALTNVGSFTVNPTLNSVAVTAITGTGTGLTVNVTMKVANITILTQGSFTALGTLAGNIPTSDSATGTGATLDLSIGVGNTVTITNTGTGYASLPAVTFGGTGLTGATGTAVKSAAGIAHTGWVIRKEGTGGRAGRIQTEVLVAGGITTDASDDTILPE